MRNLEAAEARLARQAQRDSEQARGQLISELLPVLDNLDRSIAAGSRERADTGMLEGVRMVRRQLENVLRGYGVERIDAVGKPFDPSVHEAIGIAPVDSPRRDGMVIDQAEPGFRFAGKLLRAAKVTVGRLMMPGGIGGPGPWR